MALHVGPPGSAAPHLALVCVVPDTPAFPALECEAAALLRGEDEDDDFHDNDVEGLFVALRQGKVYWEGQAGGAGGGRSRGERILVFAVDPDSGEATLVNGRDGTPVELHPRVDLPHHEPPPHTSGEPSMLVDTFGSKNKKKSEKLKEESKLSNSRVSKRQFIKDEMEKAFVDAEEARQAQAEGLGGATPGGEDVDLLLPKRNLHARHAKDMFVKDDYFPESRFFDDHVLEREFAYNEEYARIRKGGKYLGAFPSLYAGVGKDGGGEDDDDHHDGNGNKTTEKKRLAVYCGMLIRFFRDFPERATLVDAVRAIAGKEHPVSALIVSAAAPSSSSSAVSVVAAAAAAAGPDPAYRDAYKEVVRSLLVRFTTPQHGERWKRFKSARERLLFVILLVALELTGKWALSQYDLELLQGDLGLSKSLSAYLYRLGTRPKSEGAKGKVWVLKPENVVVTVDEATSSSAAPPPSKKKHRAVASE